MKRNSPLKARKIEQVKQWLNKLTTNKYGYEILQPYNGDELDGMTIKQIQMVLNYIRVTYHAANVDRGKWQQEEYYQTIATRITS